MTKGLWELMSRTIDPEGVGTNKVSSQKEEEAIERGCNTCAFDGFDMPRCKECNPKNGFMLWAKGGV
jgi:hypothetical protein